MRNRVEEEKDTVELMIRIVGTGKATRNYARIAPNCWTMPVNGWTGVVFQATSPVAGNVWCIVTART